MGRSSAHTRTHTRSHILLVKHAENPELHLVKPERLLLKGDGEHCNMTKESWDN